MSNGDTGWISDFIWGIADDVLRDVYVRGKYRDVILPMTVIRRLDAVLEPTKETVRNMKERLDSAGIANPDAALRQAAGQAFYNTSPYTLRDLKARGKAQQLKADFESYLDGFSPNVQEILEKFKFRNQIPTLVEADILGSLIEKFLDPSVNLSPNPVYAGDGSVRLPGLDNHGMGTIFEELIRRFNEENNEEAGEHFTPRDVVQLMADLVLRPIAGEIRSGTYLVYDGACGTGGMLTVAEKRLLEIAREHGKEVSIHLYGQEVNPETYAITKADLLLKGEGEEADNFRLGSTLSQDGFPAHEFDFMLSNPPYGKSWKTDLERMGGKGDIRDPRFIIEHAGGPEFSLSTRSSDGQLMFLVNRVGKVQLIDATAWYRPLRKNLGKKNCELSEPDIARICDLFLGFEENAQSKILRNEAFGYWRVTVERPLRIKGIDPERVYSPKEVEGLKTAGERDENAPPLIKKMHKSGTLAADPLRGLFEVTIQGRLCVVEYEPDSELRDTEQVPLMEDGGIEAFLRREVLPYVSDSWYDPTSVRIGYEIRVNRYFYKPEPLRQLDEIRSELLVAEKEADGLLQEILGPDLQ